MGASKSLQMVIAAMKLKDTYSVGEGNGNPLQYSCLENPVDRGTWWTTVHGVAKSWTPLSEFTLTFTYAFLLGRKVMTNLDKACSKAETLLCQERSF